MLNPYAGKPNSAFWPRSMAGRGPAEVDPLTSVPFQLRRTDAVATAGSCFAQHISGTLQECGMRFLVTEAAPATPGATAENFGVFPARFGNIYTVRQLRQLFERCFSLFDPVDVEWRSPEGHSIDPFRPRIQAGGFASAAALCADRDAHLQAVQAMFETCDVFVFTLGLTEGWESTVDGAVFPLAPGLFARGLDEANYRFHNFTVAEMEADMGSFIRQFRAINPDVRIILRVSPVALIATYEDRHVLVSNTYSKAALRVVADSVARAFPGVAYFPAYEIITGPHARSSFLSDDLREVTPAGIAHVMSLFSKHFLADGDPMPAAANPLAAAAPAQQPNRQEAEMRALQRVICDEDLIGRV
jgi:hypothetical protein